MRNRVVIDHVWLMVADLEASRRFYAAALAPLGFAEVGRDDAGGTGYGAEDADDDFWIGPVPDGGTPTSGVHVAFVAAGTAEVDAFYAAALAAGGTEVDDAEDYGFMYSRSFYDLDGHGWQVMWMDPVAAEQGPAAFAASMQDAPA
jgi:predicted lactoylglutathione lyase